MLLLSKVSLFLLCSLSHTVQTLQITTKSSSLNHLENTSPKNYPTPIKYVGENFKPNKQLFDPLLKNNGNSFETTTARVEDMAYLAAIEVTYMDGDVNKSFNIVGKLSGFIDPEPITGVLVEGDGPDGCNALKNKIKEKWIALVVRGNCDFNQKVNNALNLNNASGILVFNFDPNKPNNGGNEIIAMRLDTLAPAAFISHQDGKRLLKIMQNHHNVVVTIRLGSTLVTPSAWTSPILLSMSVLFLIFISIIWLIFYYVQRFRYRGNASSTSFAERAQRLRISKKMKKLSQKVLDQMEQRKLKPGDPFLTCDNNMCSICVEDYQVNDLLRILPCKHSFHLKCVDGWLIKNRRCPICQADILTHSQFLDEADFEYLSLWIENSRSSSNTPTNNNEINTISTNLNISNRVNNANARNNTNVFNAYPNERDILNSNNTNNNNINNNYDVESYIEDDEDDDVLARHLQIWTSLMMNDNSKISQPTNTLHETPRIVEKVTSSKQNLQHPVPPTSPYPASHLSHSSNVHSFANSLEKMIFNKKSEDSLMANDIKFKKTQIYKKHEIKNDNINTGSLPLLTFDCSQKQIRNLKTNIPYKNYYDKKSDQIKQNSIPHNNHNFLASSSAKTFSSMPRTCNEETSDNVTGSKPEMTRF